MPKLTLSLNAIIQGLATASQFINSYDQLVPEKYKIYITSGLAIIQGITAILSHLRNPEGQVVSTISGKPQLPV